MSLFEVSVKPVLAQFRSLTRQELAQLLMASGTAKLSMHSAYDDQAYLAVAEKPRRS